MAITVTDILLLAPIGLALVALVTAAAALSAHSRLAIKALELAHGVHKWTIASGDSLEILPVPLTSGSVKGRADQGPGDAPEAEGAEQKAKRHD